MTDHPTDPGRRPEEGAASGAAPEEKAPPAKEGGAGAPEALVGTVLAGRYRILRCLGEGAMGSVYLGEHLNFGRRDAIKVLHPSMAQDPEATRRFLRGARNVSTINHPNVCTVYDFSDTDDGLQFLAMEFVEGETLSDTLDREGALSPSRAVHIVEQAAAALQAAHDQDIVHRDLKPGNIMLARARDGSDIVKVVDFDIAKGSREGEGSEVTRMGFVVGTPEYMSPEQLTGDPLDGRSDIYSLALVLFRLLTGSLPVRSTTTQDLLVERLTKDPLSLREVTEAVEFPPGLQPALDRALQRRREDRYPTATAFAEDLAGALARGGGAPGATLGVPATSGPGGAGSAGRDLPATRVSDPGHVPHAGGPTGRSGPGGGRRALAWGLGMVALVAVTWGGYVVLSNGADASPADPDDLSQVVDDDPLDPPPDDAPEVDTGGAGDAVAEREPGADDAATDPPGDDDPDPGTTDPALPFPVADARAVMFRQQDSLYMGSGSATALQAAADTAALVVELVAAPASVRAIAAYILGDVNATRGDTATAIRWLERALELDPTYQGPRTLLDLLRGGTP